MLNYEQQLEERVQYLEEKLEYILSNSDKMMELMSVVTVFFDSNFNSSFIAKEAVTPKEMSSVIEKCVEVADWIERITKL